MTRAGTPYTGPRGPGVWRHLFVLLVPDRAWWTAAWNHGQRDDEIYVDVSTPAVWHGDRVGYVDLDLDVVRYRDGRCAVLDEDEFAEHRVSLGYPARIAGRAERTASELLDAVRSRVEPFDTDGARWLERVVAAGRSLSSRPWPGRSSPGPG